MQAKKEYNLGLKPPSWNPHIPVMAMGSAPKFAATGTEPRLAADGNGNDWVDNPLAAETGSAPRSAADGWVDNPLAAETGPPTLLAHDPKLCPVFDA